MPDLSAVSDEELMSAYVAGDAAAHRALFDRLAPVVLGLARRHLQDHGEAEDIVQRVFLSIHNARHDFDRGRKLRPWAITITMNLIRDAYRRRARRREASLEIDLASLPQPASRDRLEQREEARKVLDALEQLPIEQRRAIELHWLEERSFLEVSRLVGASVTAVKVRAHRGYKRMRALLEIQREDEALWLQKESEPRPTEGSDR